MAQWGNTDDAANSVLWAAAQLKVPANTDNQTALFGNTTADAFITGATIGQYGVDAAEAQAARAGANTKAAHAGWVLRTVGSGGRAGRVHNEVLVAMSSITGDAEDVRFADYKINIVTQPSNATGDISNNDIVAFTVVAASVPTGATLGYKWQKWGGSSFSNITDAGAYSNSATATLSVLANTASSGEIYRVQVSTTGAANAISANAVLTTVA
jgi:hypothetical protein